jgi:phosphoglycerate dehydrogenase-like enzyme
VSPEPSPYVIWCNLPFGDAASPARRRLVNALGGHVLHAVDATTPPEVSRALLDQAAVVFGQPPADALLASLALRWVEISSAGYEVYDGAELRAALSERGVIMTNAGGVYADACAQHTLAMMLAACRSLPVAMDLQRERRWGFAELRTRMRCLSDQRVLILGWGQIARRLADLLAPYDLEVTAVRRRVAGDEPVRVIAAAALDEALAETDHLVNLLPGGAGTARFVDERRLARLKPGAWFYNVGRGSTVDQAALLAALERGHLAGAWLDVTDPEPLPSDHPLWRTPGCYISPHLAGGQVDERGHQVRHFVSNLARFAAGTALVDRIG